MPDCRIKDSLHQQLNQIKRVNFARFTNILVEPLQRLIIFLIGLPGRYPFHPQSKTIKTNSGNHCNLFGLLKTATLYFLEYFLQILFFSLAFQVQFKNVAFWLKPISFVFLIKRFKQHCLIQAYFTFKFIFYLINKHHQRQ